MANNKIPPSFFSLNSKNESSINNHVRLSTHSGNSSAMVGAMRENVVSHATTTTNDTPMVLIPSPARTSTKKRRGRPLGSKNRPKPPTNFKEDRNTRMEIVCIEIPTGRDIVGALVKYARRRQVDMTVLRGNGFVSHVTFLRPESRAHVPPMVGPFEMTSLFGTYCGHVPSQSINDPPCSSFSIFLSGNGARVYGGIVGGEVIAAKPIWITAALFKTPKCY